jgi:hypothetical protein
MPDIPHSSIVRSQLDQFLGDTHTEIARISRAMSREPEFSGVFRNSVAGFAVLARFSRKSRITLLSTAASIVGRCPLLIAVGQLKLAQIELRRFVEAVSRYPYFCEHPVEWTRLLDQPAAGVNRDSEDPIAWCANREQRWYLDYIRSRFVVDSSGLILKSANDLSALYRDMSAHVHTSVESSSPNKLLETLRAAGRAELNGFRESQRRAYAAGVIAALAPRPSTLGRLTAVELAWFEWLVGKKAAQAIRGGKFAAAG